ncbi:MAG: hypothetical protein ACRBFS_02250 [Aureispira sp.]
MNMKDSSEDIHYPYQLERYRFVLLFLTFGGGTGLFLYWSLASSELGVVQLLCALLSLICLVFWSCLNRSFFTKKELILKEDYFICPQQSPLFMFRQITIAYKDIFNIQKIDHAGSAYLMIKHQQGQLFIGEGMLSDTVVFEKLHYFLFYKLGQELPSRTST